MRDTFPRRGRLPRRGLFCSVFARFSSLPPRVARATATKARPQGELARLAVTERGKRGTLRNIPSRVILSEPQVSRTFAACRKSAVGFSPMRNPGRTTCLHPCPARSSGRTLRPSPSFHSGFDCAQDDTRGWHGEGILCLLPSPSHCVCHLSQRRAKRKRHGAAFSRSEVLATRS